MMENNFTDEKTCYTLTRERVWKYFWKTNWFGVAMFIMSFVPLIMLIHQHQIFTAFFIFIIFFVFWLSPFLLFTKYYNYAKDKILYLAKEENVFKYGATNNLVSYCKNDIENIIVHIRRNYMVNSYAGFSYMEINMKNEAWIYIPNILIDNKQLVDMFNGFTIEDINEVPRLLI